jgi:uncharacterized protein YndB with AHSA1/START domain
MPTYLITNRVPAGFTGSPEAFAAWTTWFTELGDSLVDRGNPAFSQTTLGNGGPGTVLGGYTLITAGSLEEAAALAAGHPLLARGGGIEIGELTPLNKGRGLNLMPESHDGSDVVEVSVYIAAPPETVFTYLTDSARYAEWMGSGAILDPVPGGIYHVRMDDGFAAAGRFMAVDPPRRVVFTWGWADNEAAQHVLHERQDDDGGLPAGSTRVAVTLDAHEGGTRLTLRHHNLATRELLDAHREAWHVYLDRLTIRAAGGDPGPDPHSG